jgi:membrane peptidoglycan carboxypeptidase
LSEITTAYQTILTGKVFKCKDGDWTEPCLIKEIKNRDGRTIFKNDTESKVVLDDAVTTQMGAMLRSVFKNGTARSQYANITVSNPEGAQKLRYPALGKTGTTNDYRNVAFMGALPTYVKDKNGIALDSVVAIGSYVGFDDNKPLKSGRTRIAGASGGLPQWAAFAKEEIGILGIPEQIDFLDISMMATGEVPLILTNERGELTVDPMTGRAMAGANSAEGRPLPWLDVPGFTPPQVQERAAAASAEMGILTSMPMPTVTDSGAPAIDGAIGPDAGSMSQPPAPQPAQDIPAATGQPVAPKAAAMPKDDDWDLPEGLGGNAFVPIEAE